MPTVTLSVGYRVGLGNPNIFAYEMQNGAGGRFEVCGYLLW